MTEKKLLFSVTAKDCKWSYTRGTGAGGQKRNKTSSAVHCTHEPSGAHGYREDTRSQHENKMLAFKRMAESEKFKKWLRIETMRRTGELHEAEQETERQMRKIRVEIRREGKWVEVDKNDPLDVAS